MLVATYGIQAGEATTVQVVAALSLVGSMLAFIVCGALIVSRQPRNIVGWLLMIPGLVLPASTLATNWLGSMPPPQEVTPVLWLVLWALSWSWILLIFPILHLLLTFPDGRLLSPRWRLAVALEVAMAAIFLGFTAFAQDLGVLVNDEIVWTVENPIGFLPNDMFDALAGQRLGGRAGGDDDRERGGRRGPVPAGIDRRAPAAQVAAARGRLLRRRLRRRVVDPSLVGDGSILFGFSLAGIPISVAIAVLRYRLYAIDHIISRTIAWAVVTAVLRRGVRRRASLVLQAAARGA